MSDIKVSDEFKERMQKLKIAVEQCAKSFENISMKLNALKQSEMEKSIKISNLEARKKHCKNYLELKQIDRELNALKFGRRKK